MKQTILSLTLLLSFTLLFAQKSNVRKAKNLLLQEVPDYKSAREAILPALKDSTTDMLAETWYYAGMIGYKEGTSPLTTNIEVKGKAVLESYSYFQQSLKLDSMPDAKGKIKPKFTKEIKEKIKDFYNQRVLVQYGADLLNKKNFEGAINSFENYMSMPKLPVLNNELKIDSLYTKIKYYTTIACINARKSDKAINYLQELKNENFETMTVYQFLCEEYNKKKDSVMYEKTLREGFEKFPNDTWFLQNLINIYIFSNRTTEAMNYLNTAIERDPKSAQYWFVKGNLEENIGKLDSAMISFDKAIELNDKLAEAYAGKGRLLFNKAVKLSEAADGIRDVKIYKVEMKKADAIFRESLPFFLKSTELKPKSVEYKETLKTLYYRLKMDAEYEAITKEIKAM